MKLNNRVQVLFLLFVVLGVYYPSIFAGLNSVDDWKMVADVENRQVFHLVDIFRPGAEFYYRPLLMLTFIADGYFWGLIPSFMHLENMLLHAANSLLVFWVARRVFESLTEGETLYPLIAALLFALHPINTESVNWISGRTDLLATFFILLSLRALIHSVERSRPVFALGAAGLFLAGVMSKEMVLFFLPAAVFLAWRWPVRSMAVTSERRRRKLNISLFCAPFALGGLAYLGARFSAFGTGDGGTHFILDRYAYSLFDTVRVFFKVFGFYVKKLFMPLPLNFAIVGASDLYAWLGLLAAAACFFLLRRQRIETDLLNMAFYLILPAIVIALTNVAWTPVAERYLYLPSAFWAVGAVGGLHSLLAHYRRERLVLPVLAAVLLLAGGASAHRALVWQDPLRLYQDTVAKSPNYAPARNELGVALMSVGRNDDAKAQFEAGQSLDPNQHVHQVYFNQIRVSLEQDRIEEARSILDKIVESEKEPSADWLREVAKVSEAMLLKELTAEQKQWVLENLLPTYEQLYFQTRDPFIRYREAQVAMFLGEKGKAADYFREAFEQAPRTAHYKEAAGKLAAKLCTE